MDFRAALASVDAALAQLGDAVASMDDAAFLRAHQAAHDERQRPAVDLVAAVFEADYWRRWPHGRDDAESQPTIPSASVARAAAAVLDAFADARTAPRAVLMERRDVITVEAARQIAGKDESTIRRWVRRFGIGRSIGQGSRIEISQPALLAVMSRDFAAVDLMRDGNRTHESVIRYHGDERAA
jgi:hypothetical protein